MQFPPQPRPQRPPSFKLCKRFQSTESFPRPSCEHCVCKRWREGCTPPDPPLFKTVPALFSAYESCPSLSCAHCLQMGGLRPPQPPRFLKPCQLASKQRNPFRTHHESIPPRLKGLCFLAGQTCFNHTNPFQIHDDASIVFANGGGSLRFPSKHMMRALCFQMRRSAQPPTPLTKEGIYACFPTKIQTL